MSFQSKYKLNAPVMRSAQIHKYVIKEAAKMHVGLSSVASTLFARHKIMLQNVNACLATRESQTENAGSVSSTHLTPHESMLKIKV